MPMTMFVVKFLTTNAMKESLRIKIPGLLLKLSNVEIKPIHLDFGLVVNHFLKRLVFFVPAEAIITFIGIQVITENSCLWLPYVGTILVILLRFLSHSFQSEERPFDISGFMVVISVLAYTIWNSAIAVFVFLCTLLFMTF